MKEILSYSNKQLISKYDKYYIRFVGGRYAELTCDIKITDNEANNIISNPELIMTIFNDYRGKLDWSAEYFIKTGLEDYLKEEEYSDDEVEQILIRLGKYENIKYEMYESIITEQFPIKCLVQVNGRTAKDIYEEDDMSMGEAYVRLLEVAENNVMDK